MDKQAQDGMAKLLTKEVSLDAQVRTPYRIARVEEELKGVQDARKTRLTGFFGALWRKTRSIPLERKEEALKAVLADLKSDFLKGAVMVPITLEEQMMCLQKSGALKAEMDMSISALPVERQKAERIAAGHAMDQYYNLRFVWSVVKRKTADGWMRYFAEEELTTLDPWLVNAICQLYQTRIALSSGELKN